MGEGIASFVSYMDSACISLPSPFSKCIGASEKRCLLAGHQALLKGNHPMRHYQLNHYLISPKCSGRAGQKQQVEQRGTLSSAPIYSIYLLHLLTTVSTRPLVHLCGLQFYLISLSLEISVLPVLHRCTPLRFSLLVFYPYPYILPYK